MKSKLKSKLSKKLLESGKVKDFDVIEHSFADNGDRDIDRLIVSTDGIFPTITTRPDVLGVVVNDKDE